MKVITRIVIILLAALIVVGVTMAVTNSSGTAQAAPNLQERQPPQLGDGNFVPGQQPDRGPDGEGGASLGWVNHLVPIAGIVFVVVIVERLWAKIFKPQYAKASTAK